MIIGDIILIIILIITLLLLFPFLYWFFVEVIIDSYKWMFKDIKEKLWKKKK